jgi:quinol monooxygenase YgiN
MAVAVRINPEHMTRDDYQRVIAELRSRGVHDPEGRVFHAAYGEDPVMMFEVWHSRELFERHRGDLFEALESAGLDGGAVEVHAVHSEHPD